MFNNRLNQENITPTELEKILAGAGLEAEPGAVNLYIIDKLTYASNITNSTIVQGNKAESIDVGNGKAADTGAGDKWAAELLRIYKALDVKKRTALLSYAYQLEEQAEQEQQEQQQEQQTDQEQECRV
ncbi:hypothetical protein GGQ84_001628 [Desulfitispora alkaliphila]|uniref:hypothetical protein n=1 Tax=Desulfitispora alkaliphila TaxID=622674 RepID=UPI003D22E329